MAYNRGGYYGNYGRSNYGNGGNYRRRSYGRSNYGYSSSRRKSKYTKVEKFAFMAGLVQRGKKNPDSKVTESYNAGLSTSERAKKTLF